MPRTAAKSGRRPCSPAQQTQSLITHKKREFRKTQEWINRICPLCGGHIRGGVLVGHHVLPRQPFPQLRAMTENVVIGCAGSDCGGSLDRDRNGARVDLAERIVRIAHLMGLKKAVWARRECRKARVPVKRTGRWQR